MPQFSVNGLQGIIFLFLLYYYDWTSRPVNLGIVLAYVLVIVGELLVIGLPSKAAYLQETGLRKGLLFDGFVAMLPLLYLAFRAMLVIPLIQLLRLPPMQVNASKIDILDSEQWLFDGENTHLTF